MQPRDYYDIWYLVEVEGMDVEYYTNEFRNKYEDKEIKPENFYRKPEQKITTIQSKLETLNE